MSEVWYYLKILAIVLFAYFIVTTIPKAFIKLSVEYLIDSNFSVLCHTYDEGYVDCKLRKD